ncbi:MAG: FG-GAP-like repeat-containing protein [Planctomycetota bacterium]|nr:FG-GAP-like repeat-containing protein [Planctomycetota bacterium]MDA1249939.1 FG-GAP-like repeat-containing protein [Planctomycetota bacterium]
MSSDAPRPSPAEPTRTPNRRIRFGVVSLTIVVAATSLTWHLSRPTAVELTAKAAQEAALQHFENAAVLANQALDLDPDAAKAHLVAAECALQQGEADSANHHLNLLQPLELDTNDNAKCGLLLMKLGRVFDAEIYFRKALSTQPAHLIATTQLMTLLRIQGRNFEILTPLLESLKAGLVPHEALFPAGCPTRIWVDDQDREFIDLCRQKSPDDPLIEMGFAVRSAKSLNDPQPAIRLLHEIILARPDLPEPHAQLGRLLLESGAVQELKAWEANLPRTAISHPDIWFTRGTRARLSGQMRQAIRCFYECLVLSPNHRAANYQLSQLLLEKHPEPSAALARRASHLAELEDLILYGDGQGGPATPATMTRISEKLQTLGRMREAIAWTAGLNTPAARQRISALRSQLNPDTGLVAATHLQDLSSIMSEYPLSEIRRVDDVPPTDTHTQPVQFANIAKSSGLEFSYFNGADRKSGKALMFEFSGGGIAVLDYDGDLWPDIYLTQGCAWPPSGDPQIHRDRLFRNLGNGHFEDVTAAAFLGDTLYTQGATAGDYNNDGWPDLYVCNIGRNRLYLNNTDGTFTETTAEARVAGDAWTISAVIADLNNDSFPDIYAVNYLSGDDIYSRSCSENGHPVQCAPTMFPAAQDRLYLGQGDGSFRDATDDTDIVLPDGKGMGIVAANLNGTALSLFIANDTTANFLLTPAKELPFRFENSATAAGIAFGDSGRAQSCMGTAAGDCNNDGMIDFFTTNFVVESNNLFLQQQPGIFQDEIRASGLQSPGYSVMGWGAQFLDANLDGHLDLVVANGHLQEYGEPQSKSLMPTQVFVNHSGSFSQQSASSCGGYFTENHLGRCVATLDWNRDGRKEFCVTHVDAPVGLMRNDTETTSESITIHLRARQTARDAIGARVTLIAGGRRIPRQLTAGDGFQASNQRTILLASGKNETGGSIEVIWPSGRQQTFGPVSTGRELILVEDLPDPFDVTNRIGK